MRLANVRGRPQILAGDGGGYRGIDVHAASGGRFPADSLGLLERWDEFRDWHSGQRHEDLASTQGAGQQGPVPVEPADFGAPVPQPRQVFAIGMNYRDHASETGLGVPPSPSTFTKFPTCITGPVADVALPPGDVDWEVELVVVAGRTARRVPAESAWDFVAGVCVGQDLSERRQQLMPPSPQFSLGKSHEGFGPTGPYLVTPDELDDPDDLALGCTLNGAEMQKGRTRDLLFPVPELIARLSAVVTILPGDLIFTGTPAGVGLGRKPPRFLSAGDELVSYVDQVGEITTRLVALPPQAGARA